MLGSHSLQHLEKQRWSLISVTAIALAMLALSFPRFLHAATWLPATATVRDVGLGKLNGVEDYEAVRATAKLAGIWLYDSRSEFNAAHATYSLSFPKFHQGKFDSSLLAESRARMDIVLRHAPADGKAWAFRAVMAMAAPASSERTAAERALAMSGVLTPYDIVSLHLRAKVALRLGPDVAPATWRLVLRDFRTLYLHDKSFVEEISRNPVAIPMFIGALVNEPKMIQGYMDLIDRKKKS